MKSVVSFVLMTVLLFKIADAELKILRPQQPPAGVPYQDGCWSPDLKQYIAKEATVAPIDGKCMEHTCGVDGYIRTYTCPRFGGNCEVIEGNPKAAFPKCCSKINCKDGQIGYGLD